MTSGRVLGASTDDTTAKLADLQDQINALSHAPQTVFVPSFSGPAASTPVSTATFAQSQKIDNLSGTSLSNVTVSGVSGLTDADIPDTLTASNYLPLTGGTLTGTITSKSTVSTAGSELLANGTFDGSAAGWTLGSNVTYNNDHSVTSLYSSTRADRTVSTTYPTVCGKTYLLTLTVSAETGPLFVYFTHNTLGSAASAEGPFENGTHSVALKTNYTGTETITFDYRNGDDWWYDYVFGNPIGETWTLSNVSIKEVSDLSPALVVKGYDNSSWLSLGNNLGVNTALGWNALGSAGDDSVYNTALGANALYHNTTGNLNTAVGWNALYFTTTGVNNTAIGADALFMQQNRRFQRSSRRMDALQQHDRQRQYSGWRSLTF